MKTPFDPRHLSRQKTIQALFEWSFRSDVFKEKRAREIVDNLEKVDREIANSAPEWSIDKISKIDLAILRLAVYELIIVKTAPVKVIIDEAVELAKEFGGETSAGFVNGALGKVVKNFNNVICHPELGSGSKK